MPGVKGKSGGAREGAGRRRDPLKVGKEVFVRRTFGEMVEAGRIFTVVEYAPKRIVLQLKVDAGEVGEKIIIRA